MELLPEIHTKYTPDILLSMAEIQQPRTNFQLEKFVVGQHDTKEMQYRQCLLELQQLYYSVRTINLKIKQDEIKIKKLKSSEDEIDNIEAEILEVGLEQTRLLLIGTYQEIDALIAIYDSFDHKYTRKEIEIAQTDYWHKRLNRQAILEQIGGSQAQAAHLDALRQIGLLEVTEQGIKPIIATESIEERQTREIL